MKQKLPKKESSSKNLYLSETKKSKIFSNSETKSSLLRLSIAKFFHRKYIVNSFNFRMISLSIDLRNLKRSEHFILNTFLMLFVLPVIMLIHRSNYISIVNQNKFNLTKIQPQSPFSKNYIGIYKKSFENLNKNLDSSLQNFVKKKRKIFKQPSIFETFKRLNDPIFLYEPNYLLKKKMESFNFYKKFLDFYLFEKQIEDPDYFRMKKEILQNLQNWGESNEILMKSSFLLKEKENLYLSNYIKVYLWEFLTKNSQLEERVQLDIITQKNWNYSDSEPNNPKLYITLENLLSDAIYRFSRYLSYKIRESNSQMKNTYFFTKKLNKDINLLDSSLISKRVKKNLRFFDFINPDQLCNLRINNSNFEGITRMFYLDNELAWKFAFSERAKSVSALKEEKPTSYFDSLKKELMVKFSINHLFSQQTTKKVNNSKFTFSFEPLVVDDIRQNTILKKELNKISKSIKRFDPLKKNMEYDDIQIISCKIKKYYSNFLVNYSLPSNCTYNIICENYSRYKAKKNYGLLIKIFNLSPFVSELKKTFSAISCIELKEQLIIKNTKLDILIDQFNKIEKTNFTIKIRLKSTDSTYTNEPINGFSGFKYLIQNNYYRYYNKLFSILPFREKCEKNILNKYSTFCKTNIKQSIIYNIESLKYTKLNFKIYNWLYEIKNSSKRVFPFNFFMNLKLTRIFKKYFQKLDSKNINKIYNLLQTSTNISGISIEPKKLLNPNLVKKNHCTEIDINKLISKFLMNERNKKSLIDSLTIFHTKNNLLSDWTQNEKLCFHDYQYKLNLYEFLINFQSNYKKKFLLSWEKNDIENNTIIYAWFLKNLLKYNKLNQTSLEQRFLIHKEQIFQLVQLKFNEISFFKIADKTKAVSFLDLYTRIGFLVTPKISFSEVHKNENQIEAINQRFLPNFNNKYLNYIKIENFYNRLQYESLIGSRKRNNYNFQYINKISLSPILKYLELKDLKGNFKNKILIPLNKLYEKSTQIEFLNFFDPNILFDNYTSWFFTSEWWEYSIHVSLGRLCKNFVRIGFYFEYFINNNIKLIKKNLINLYNKKLNLYALDSKWTPYLFFGYTEKIILNFLWSDLYLINSLNNLHLAIFSSIIFISLFCQNYFSIFIGSDFINLWKHFENIKYLTDSSRAFYFTELSYRNKRQSTKTENFLIHFFSNLNHYIKNIRFYLLTKKTLNKWLSNQKSLDLSRRKRNLLVQSLITTTRLKEYGLKWYYQPKLLNNKLFGYRRDSQQGISYIRYLGGMFKKNLVNCSVHQADKWIFFASLQKIISSQTLQQTKNFEPSFQKIPIPLQLGLSCSKGILLIGPIESGRSYLIKNLAADSSVPLLGISINKLLYNKPDVITESWMNILIESLRRLNLILDLAKGMSPCIIWIRNIHQLDINRSTQNIESDPTFLLGILLKHFQTDSLKTRTKNNIIMIGSTHIPKKVDPSLILPDRLDRILNIRLLNTYQRKNQFPILLKRNNLELNKNLVYFNEFGSRTMGYNTRDLIGLTNEISLISITKNKSFIDEHILKLAFHRYVLGFSHTNNRPNYQQNFKILLYKIGRAVIQNLMIESSATNPLSISNYLWKKKFYYLSKWYSEPVINDSIIKESIVLINVLSSLAGIAARDAWFLLENESNLSISLDKSVENDLDLAFSLLETFSSDFPWLETCENHCLNYEKNKSKIFLTKNFLNIMHNGLFAIAKKSSGTNNDESQYEVLLSKTKIINQKVCEFTNTAWSPRFWRLNFSRSHLFNWTERPNNFMESFHTFGSSKKKGLDRKNYNEKFARKKKETLFYERILPRVRKRNVEELETQFENILLEEQFEILGFFSSSTQYQMEYKLDNKPRLFIGKRILWDPICSFSQSSHFVLPRQEFFVDEEMLRRLYITYGVRRERERSLSSHRIKRFFICRGYKKDSINKLSVRWWNQLPIDQKQNIYALKRIEKISIRLKRPQIFTPVYLYQRWLIENIPGKFSRLDLLTHRDRWIQLNTQLLDDSLLYTILLECYQYLIEFFLSNKILLNQITKTLLRKKWIFQDEIRDIIHNLKIL